MDDSLNQTQTKKKAYFIRKKADEQQKQSKMYGSLPGLPNYIIPGPVTFS